MKKKNPSKTEITGTARNAKGGAVVVTESGDPIYVEKLEEWPGEIDGKKIAITGILLKRKLIPDPVVDADGAISQGAEGEQDVLRNARWTLLKN